MHLSFHRDFMSISHKGGGRRGYIQREETAWGRVEVKSSEVPEKSYYLFSLLPEF